MSGTILHTRYSFLGLFEDLQIPRKKSTMSSRSGRFGAKAHTVVPVSVGELMSIFMNPHLNARWNTGIGTQELKQRGAQTVAMQVPAALAAEQRRVCGAVQRAHRSQPPTSSPDLLLLGRCTRCPGR